MMFGQAEPAMVLPTMEMSRWRRRGSGWPSPPGATISMAGRRQPVITLPAISTSLELADSLHQYSGATSTAAIQPWAILLPTTCPRLALMRMPRERL